MNLYKQENKEISTYLRTNKVVLNNPLNAVPGVQIYEEKVLDVAGDVSTKQVSILTKSFTSENASTEFPLLNPVTLEPTGQTATYADVYAMIASLYLSMATERDTAAGSEEILGEIPPIEEEQ